MNVSLTCQEWSASVTSGCGSVCSGRSGIYSSKTSQWTDAATGGCGDLKHLYCFEQ